MNILVTGGAGYIGSHAVKMLLNEGHNVTVVDNLSTGNKSMADSQATFYECSIHDTQKMIDIFYKESIESVIHFAAFSLVGESESNPLKYYQNNVEGSRSLVEAMLRTNVNNLVFSSTAAVYGEVKDIPITEKISLNPTNTYGETKRAVEMMLSNVAKAHKEFNYVSLRYFNVAGAYHDGTIGEKHDPETHLIPNVIKSVIHQTATLKVFGDDYPTRDGSAIRDYIHVEDLIVAHIKALEYLKMNNASNVFNLGSAKGYSVLEILHAVDEISAQDVNYSIASRRVGDPAVLIASHDKANRILGWQPIRTLKDILASAYAFHREDEGNETN